jgi:putative RNA 2'-phosphotransferase
MKDPLIATSKFLSLVLRHRPDVLGIELDAEGWVAVEDLLTACAQQGRAISREQLDAVVRTNDKQRFAFSADGSRIRANQGHSLPVDLGLVPVEPPELLYHGTVPRFLDSIRRDGLTKGHRHHVHLSPDIQMATKVGQRPWKMTTVIPVFSMALVCGQPGSRRWLVYAHSPLEDRHGVQITLPDFGTLKLDVPRAGLSSIVEEQSPAIRLVNPSGTG